MNQFKSADRDVFEDTQVTTHTTFHVVYSLESDELLLTVSTIPLKQNVYYPVYSVKAGTTVPCVYLGVL